MKYFKIIFENGDTKIAKGETMLDVINEYDLADGNEHIVELEGEQLAIAIANEQDDE